MALLDELKKLVASVENAKEDFYTTYQKDKCIKKESGHYESKAIIRNRMKIITRVKIVIL